MHKHLYDLEGQQQAPWVLLFVDCCDGRVDEVCPLLGRLGTVNLRVVQGEWARGG